MRSARIFRSAREINPELGRLLDDLKGKIGEEMPDELVCEGCGQLIVEGQHYTTVITELATKMPPSWQPVVEIEPTVLTTIVHNPRCYLLWAARNAILLDVLGR